MGAAGAAAASARNLWAIKASGVIISVDPQEFLRILQLTEEPLVVTAEGGFFKRGVHYVTSYKGFAFYAFSREEVQLPERAQIVRAEKIWMP